MPWENTISVLENLCELLTCSLCLRLVEKPNVLGGCQHFFCKSCVEDYLVGEACPCCGMPSHARDIMHNRQLHTAVTLVKELHKMLLPKGHRLVQNAQLPPAQNDVKSSNNNDNNARHNAKPNREPTHPAKSSPDGNRNNETPDDQNDQSAFDGHVTRNATVSGNFENSNEDALNLVTRPKRTYARKDRALNAVKRKSNEVSENIEQGEIWTSLNKNSKEAKENNFENNDTLERKSNASNIHESSTEERAVSYTNDTITPPMSTELHPEKNGTISNKRQLRHEKLTAESDISNSDKSNKPNSSKSTPTVQTRRRNSNRSNRESTNEVNGNGYVNDSSTPESGVAVKTSRQSASRSVNERNCHENGDANDFNGSYTPTAVEAKIAVKKIRRNSNRFVEERNIDENVSSNADNATNETALPVDETGKAGKRKSIRVCCESAAEDSNSTTKTIAPLSESAKTTKRKTSRQTNSKESFPSGNDVSNIQASTNDIASPQIVSVKITKRKSIRIINERESNVSNAENSRTDTAQVQETNKTTKRKSNRVSVDTTTGGSDIPCVNNSTNQTPPKLRRTASTRKIKDDRIINERESNVSNAENSRTDTAQVQETNKTTKRKSNRVSVDTTTGGSDIPCVNNSTNQTPPKLRRTASTRKIKDDQSTSRKIKEDKSSTDRIKEDQNRRVYVEDCAEYISKTSAEKPGPSKPHWSPDTSSSSDLVTTPVTTPKSTVGRRFGRAGNSTPNSDRLNRQPWISPISLNSSAVCSGVSASPRALKKNSKGETPLHVACIKGDQSAVAELLKGGAAVNVKDNAGWTPLHECVNHGHVKLAELLLDAGALIDVPGLDNDTPLHDALANHQVACVKLLVRRGANKALRNSQGKTSDDLATAKALKDALKVKVDKETSLNSTLSSSYPAFNQAVLLGTGLSREHRSLLAKCATLLKGKVVTEVSPEVTHVVTGVNQDGQCPRTIKYLQALLSGKWILTLVWAETCLEYGCLVSEEAFEVPGASSSPNSQAPRTARLNMQNQLPGLFDGCQFYFHGEFMYPLPEKQELVELVTLGGGKVLSREPKPDSLDQSELTIPYHVIRGSQLENCGYFIVNDGKGVRSEMQGPYLCWTKASWLLNCIAHYTLLDLE